MSAAVPHIGAVLFDLDGVLTTDASGSLTTVRHLQHATGIPQEAWWQAFAPYNEALLTGRTTHADVWPAICAEVGRSVPFAVLGDAFRSTPMDTAMLALAHQISRDVRIGIVTDNKRDRVDALVRLHALDAVFDPIVVSADIGSGKTSPAVFEHALRALDMPPHDVVFIDNTPANLAVPTAMGLHALHFDDAVRDIDALATSLATRFRLPRPAISPASA